jgi:hypothetical protein
MNSINGPRDLLLKIVHCPNILSCFHNGRPAHPCGRIIKSQGLLSIDRFQVPEPWSGRLLEAPLLFLSSNPSISETDQYPTRAWEDHEVEAYFEQRFEQWVVDGVRSRQQDGSYSRAVPFWSEVKGRAAELYERAVEPGKDYALTEVVHCKSRNNEGVKQALEECSDRYLSRVLSHSMAKVIVCLGVLVEQIVTEKFAIPSGARVYGPTQICGKIRHVVFSAQPSSAQPRKFSKTLSTDELVRLKAALKATDFNSSYN